jgi:hypothetical protein
MAVPGAEAAAQPSQPKRTERALGHLQPVLRPGKLPAAAAPAEPVGLVGVAGVDQHEPGHLLGMVRGVQPHMQPAGRVADQDIGRRDPCSVKQRMEVVDDLLAGGPRAWVAPAQARPVIHHHGRVLGQAALDVRPPVAGLAQRGHDHHRGAALAGAPQMQAATVDVDQVAGWREAPTVARLAEGLVGGAGEPGGEQAKNAGARQGTWTSPHRQRSRYKS